MRYALTGEEANILMDITFLLGSVFDRKLVSKHFLQQSGKLIPFEKGLFLFYDEKERQFQHCADIRCSSSLVNDFITKYQQMDYMNWELCQPNHVILKESDVIDEVKRLQTKFYTDFMQPHDIEYRICFNLVSDQKELAGIVVLTRSKLFRDFNQHELELCQLLQLHYAQALNNISRFERMSQNINIQQNIIHSLKKIVIILDDDYEVNYTNSKAELFINQINSHKFDQLLEKIKLHCNILRRRYLSGDIFWEMGEQVTDKHIGDFSIHLIPVDIDESDSGSDSCLFLITLHSDQDFETNQKNSTGLTDGPDSFEHEKDLQQRFLDVLINTYQLTTRETEVLLCAIKGQSNHEIAEGLYIGLSTVKTHFQNAFTKIKIANRKELFTLYINYIMSKEFRNQFESGGLLCTKEV